MYINNSFSHASCTNIGKQIKIPPLLSSVPPFVPPRKVKVGKEGRKGKNKTTAVGHLLELFFVALLHLDKAKKKERIQLISKYFAFFLWFPLAFLVARRDYRVCCEYTEEKPPLVIPGGNLLRLFVEDVKNKKNKSNARP